MTEQTPALNAAMAKVQKQLPKLERDRTVEVTQKNGGTYSYSYVTIANLSDAILPLLAENGLSFVAMPGAGSDGKMCLRYSLRHESGEQLSGEFPISGEGGIQMIGGRITYARRYCLAAIVGVAADEDDESRLSEEGAPRTAQRAATPRTSQAQKTAPAEGKTAQRAPARSRAAAAPPPLPGEDEPPVIDEKMRGAIFSLWNELGFSGDANREQRLTITRGILKLPDLESTSDLTPAEGKALIDALKAKRDEKKAADNGSIHNQHEPARR